MSFAPVVAGLALLATLASTPASAATWRLDPVHSRVVFLVGHAGLSRAIGTFPGVHGRLEFDPARWEDARVELAVPVARLDLGDADWTRNVLDGTFLDAADFPQAHFVSTAVEPVDEGHARVTGTLTLRGVARPVVLDVRLNAAKRHPVTRRRSVGFSATATVSRAMATVSRRRSTSVGTGTANSRIHTSRPRSRTSSTSTRGRCRSCSPRV